MVAIVTALGAVWALVVGGVAGAFVSSPLRRERASNTVRVGDIFGFTTDFRAVRLELPIRDGWYEQMARHTLYVRVNDNGDPEVLSGKCTHLGCTVQWVGERNRFECPCHAAQFAPDGAVLGGPPDRPLPQLSTEIRDGDLYVTLA